MSDDTYEIGYKKPPKNTRFTKGKSGNPKGRPKSEKPTNPYLLLAEIMNETVLIKEGGKTQEITKMEAVLKRIMNGAASGDKDSMRHLQILLKQMPDSAFEAISRPQSIRVEIVGVDGKVRPLSGD